MSGLAIVMMLGAATAFPGAEGYGSVARGGRGGAVIAVTTLADSGPGSLRACIDRKGPRVCVFRVGGVIRFESERPVIRHPYLTIAGETAPGGGILLTHAGGKVAYSPVTIKDTHDVIIRHIRVRTDRRGDERGSNSGVSIERSYNIIIDHVSTSWALDQNFGAYSVNDNITLSWSIWAEGVPPHDKCALLASHPGEPQRFSFIRNLCAHNGDRNPDANFPPGSCVEIVNNVLYNAQSQFAEIWATWGGTPVSIVGNVFRRGPNSVSAAAAIDAPLIGAKGQAQIFERDNLRDGAMAMFTPAARLAAVKAPPCPAMTRAVPAAEAYGAVIDGAGAMPRDSVDGRIIGEVRSRSGAIVRAPGVLPVIASGRPYADRDGDGMADDWERRSGSNPVEFDAWADSDGDGWFNLENFLDARHRALLARSSARAAPVRRNSAVAR